MRIVAEPLTAEAFKPFGAVLEGSTVPGRTYLSDTLANGRPHAPVSLAVATVEPKATFPMPVTVLERHEHSSQTFIPLSVSRYVILVTLDGPGAAPTSAACAPSWPAPDRASPTRWVPGTIRSPFSTGRLRSRCSCGATAPRGTRNSCRSPRP
jgi:ureidoglycolate lyase